MVIKGKCLCEGVQYQFDGEPGDMVNCHCSMCRRQHGAAFVTFITVDAGAFTWLRGEDLIAQYESSPGGYRRFCRVCGSPLPVHHPGAPLVFLPAGALESDPGKRPSAHMFVGSRSPWVEIDDDLPKFDEYPSHGG